MVQWTLVGHLHCDLTNQIKFKLQLYTLVYFNISLSASSGFCIPKSRILAGEAKRFPRLQSHTISFVGFHRNNHIPITVVQQIAQSNNGCDWLEHRFSLAIETHKHMTEVTLRKESLHWLVQCDKPFLNQLEKCNGSN